MTLRLIFMGTPDFAVPTLRALREAGHDIVAVYTQPPRAAGRGMALRRSPVQIEAERAGLSVSTPERLKSAEEQARFASLAADGTSVIGNVGQIDRGYERVDERLQAVGADNGSVWSYSPGLARTMTW